MREVVDIPVVFVPVPEKGNKGVNEKDEKEAENEDFFHADEEDRSADTEFWLWRFCCQFCDIFAHRWRRHFSVNIYFFEMIGITLG